MKIHFKLTINSTPNDIFDKVRMEIALDFDVEKNNQIKIN